MRSPFCFVLRGQLRVGGGGGLRLDDQGSVRVSVERSQEVD
eukprot:CAMPEP_0171681174 /NCGR_PEP_ID=MMETSP0990-20121206/57229_1 /TAXON_ID=483369 /ORGANISM="non described non described, Strain CCMP2098" /LENGTH=40 /DNA_ID= /DNA_START= /DNA_END= /DNA_ORIENTATION=